MRREKERTKDVFTNNQLREEMLKNVVGQEEAVEKILPYVEMFSTGLSPAGRPAGVFFLLGPTGTGKTHSVEELARALHGDKRHVLRIDCGEFQLDHEVAKLIGAPPGYLGHRETVPLISQQKLNAASSERSPLSIVLFDEIEKAAPSMTRLLLGVMDKASLKLGDNTVVNFEHSVIFLTSNLGAEEMRRKQRGGWGFDEKSAEKEVQEIGIREAKKKFAPEFVNRMDEILVYKPLTAREFAVIFDRVTEEYTRFLQYRLGARAFDVKFSSAAKKKLLEKGVDTVYGARNLKRVLMREVWQKVARKVAEGTTFPGGELLVDVKRGELVLVAKNKERAAGG